MELPSSFLVFWTCVSCDTNREHEIARIPVRTLFVPRLEVYEKNTISLGESTQLGWPFLPGLYSSFQLDYMARQSV